jgi:hypothetical protein
MYTISENNVREINEKLCLTKEDIKSLREQAVEMAELDHESEILRKARAILRSEKRNVIAAQNQHNIDIIRAEIKSNTQSGDRLTFMTACRVLRTNGINAEFATDRAVLMCLRQLVKEGYMTVKRMCVNQKGYCSYEHEYYTTVYTVV